MCVSIKFIFYVIPRYFLIFSEFVRFQLRIISEFWILLLFQNRQLRRFLLNFITILLHILAIIFSIA